MFFILGLGAFAFGFSLLAGFIFCPFYCVELFLIEYARSEMDKTPLALFVLSNVLVILIGLLYICGCAIALAMLREVIGVCFIPVALIGLVLLIIEGRNSRIHRLRLKQNLQARIATRLQLWLQDILIAAAVFGTAMTVVCNQAPNDHQLIAIYAIYEFAALLLAFLIILDACRFERAPLSPRRRALCVVLCLAISAVPIAVVIPITAWGAWRSALSKIEVKTNTDTNGIEDIFK